MNAIIAGCFCKRAKLLCRKKPSRRNIMNAASFRTVLNVCTITELCRFIIFTCYYGTMPSSYGSLLLYGSYLRPANAKCQRLGSAETCRLLNSLLSLNQDGLCSPPLQARMQAPFSQ